MKNGSKLRMHVKNNRQRRKNVLAVAIATTLGVAAGMPGLAVADTYVWGALTGPASSTTTCANSPNAAQVFFTMLDSGGAALSNSSITAKGANTYQTPTCGTLTYDTKTQSGTAEIGAFDFFGNNPTLPATAKQITLNKVPASLNGGNNNLVLANMLFDYNGTIGIPVSISYDAQGLLNEMDGTPTTFTLNKDGSIKTVNALAGTGAIPASDGTYVGGNLPGTVTGPGGYPGYLQLGPTPVATTDFNTTNVSSCTLGNCLGINPSADINGSSVVPDNTPNINRFDLTTGLQKNGIGGYPMQSGPFQGFNANFDFTSMTLVSFTDTTPPVLTLNATPNGTGVVTLVVNVDSYTEPGASCNDAPPLASYTYTVASPTGGPVDNTTIGTTILTYTCTDASGNTATKTRTVKVVGPNAVITLLANANNQIDPVTQECAVPYVDASATCTDGTDGNIPVGGNGTNTFFQVDTTAVTVSTPGTYNATWSCTDSKNITNTLNRKVNVVDTKPPVITIMGQNPDNIASSTPQNLVTYADQGATATDACDPSIGVTTTNPFATNPADIDVPDTGSATLIYKVKYVAVDASMNKATVFRTVNVTRSQPVITLNGPATIVLPVGGTYVENGMDITDAQDGNLTAVTTTGVTPGVGAGAGNLKHDIVIRDATSKIVPSIDTSVNGGRYTVTYSVTDSNSNTATQVVRKVNVGAFAVGSNFTMLDSAGNVFGGTNDVIFTWDHTFNTGVTDTTTRMTIASAKPQPFFNFLWKAHDIQVFGPGSYSFDTTCTTAQLKAGTTTCNNPLQSGQTKQFITMTVGAGQVGAHILFDWGKPSSSTACGVANCNIDVVNVWNVNGVWNQHGDKNPRNQLFAGSAGSPPDPTTTWELVSTDVNGDGINSSPMVDGPFQGFYANFNAGPASTTGPRQPYINTQPKTQLGSALASMNIFGLLGSLMVLVGLRFNRKINKK